MNKLFRQAPEANTGTERAAAVCHRLKGVSIEFLLIHSQEGGWTFPKGRLEPGETAWQAAQREAFEEAGVSGEIEQKPLTTFLYFKQVPPYLGVEYQVAAFLLLVEDVQPAQETGRTPTWFPAEEARAAILQTWQTSYPENGAMYAQELIRVIQLAVARVAGEAGEPAAVKSGEEEGKGHEPE